MARVGYARVSTIGQSLDVQLSKLSDCDKVFREKRSGTTAARPQLKACLEYLREGDKLVISRLDRLARSTFHLSQIADGLSKKGIELEVIDQAIDTSTATGKLLFNMLGAIAEFETEIRKERQMDGIAKAKEKGVLFGRKSKLSKEELQKLRQQRTKGVKIKDLMEMYGLSKATVYRLLSSETVGSEF